jgi:hypothetical protein
MSRSRHIDYADIPDLFVTIARVGGYSPLVQSGRGLPSRATLMAIRLASSFVSTFAWSASASFPGASLRRMHLCPPRSLQCESGALTESASASTVSGGDGGSAAGENTGRTVTESIPSAHTAQSAMMPTPILADVGDAFGEALVLLVQWQGGADEPVAVLDGKTTPISMIFELVAGRAFRDELPRSMLELRQTYAGRDPERKKEIAPLATLPDAARCLLTWVGYKKTKWRGK